MPYNVPNDRKYNAEHYWVKLENGVATIGRTDYWQQQNGTVTDVDITFTSGSKLKNALFGSISTNSDTPLKMPVGGNFNSYNKSLNGTPALVNSSCYDLGWLLKVSSVDPTDMTEMMDANDYKELIE